MKHALTSREKNLIIIAATVLFCTVFTVYLILPLWEKYAIVKNDLDRVKLQVTQLKDVEKMLGSSKEDIEKIENDLSDLRKHIPLEAQSAELLFYLSKAAEGSGVSLDSFDFERPSNNAESNADVRPAFSKVKVTGTYNQIRSFIVKTEELTRITHNKVITINEIKDQNKLECLIQFDTFVANYGNKELKGKSDIPLVAVGRQTPFSY